MKKYTTIFFDLDHTLWDFEKNSQEALMEIWSDLDLENRGVEDPHAFIRDYKAHNHRCWEEYRRGEISKEKLRYHRFELALADHQIHDAILAKRIGDEYVLRSPHKTHLFQGAKEVLTYLNEKYSLSVITNGFEEVQHIKIRQSGLKPFFSHIITSERAGVKKPHPDIFKLAMNLNNSLPEQTMMIGDDAEADVIAARNLNIDAVLFDPEKKAEGNPDFKVISKLDELMKWL